MKKILFGLFFMAASLQAQTSTPYDCQISATFTASTLATAAYFNKGPVAPCIAWRLTYATQNATAVSIALQGTTNLANGNPDTSNWTALTAQTGSVNPATGASAGTVAACCDYYPWIRAAATTFTGTGQTMSLAIFGYKGTSAGRTGGSGTVTGGPFTAGDALEGAGGSAIADTTVPFASLLQNPMTALGDMISGGASGAPARLPGNTKNTPLVLTSVGDGTNPSPPSWQPAPSIGNLTYYWTPTASSPTTTYYQMTVAPYDTLHTFSFAGVASNATLANFATVAGVPALTSIPPGPFDCHVRGYKVGGSTTTLYCEIWEVSATEVDIAKIGTTEQSPPLTTFETGYDLHYILPSVYTMASTTSRIVARIWENSVAAPTILLTAGGESDAHLELPSPTVDVTNFVPYLGATADLNLGPHAIIAATATDAGLAGGGTQCVQASNAGELQGTGSPCGSGSGGVTAVTGTPPLASSGGTTPAISMPFPATTPDIATPARPPAASSTSWYTKGGKLCALDPSGNETCTGGGAFPDPVTQAINIVLPTTYSYANPNGSGDRTATMSATDCPGWFSKSCASFIDGSGANGAMGPFGASWGSGSQIFLFDFGIARAISEITWTGIGSSGITGSTIIQGSADAVTWFTLSPPTPWNNSSGSTVWTIGSPFAYNYYRILTSGAGNYNSYGIFSSSQVLFKIDGLSINDPMLSGNGAVYTPRIAVSGIPVILTSCGLSPSATGSDGAGSILIGAGATGCSVAFQNAYSVVPTCVVSSEAGQAFAYTVATTGITITAIGTISATNIDFVCTGL